MNKNEIRDHEGNLFPSKKAMCEYWNVPYGLFNGRILQGWEVERALTTQVASRPTSIPCKDHLGNEFPSLSSMCRFWGISSQSYLYHKKQGESLESALTGHTRTRMGHTCTDHLGNRFASMKEMSRYWRVNYETLISRLNRGHSLEDALTSGNQNIHYLDEEKRTDHTGETFESTKEMCDHWGVGVETFKKRMEQGASLKDALDPEKKYVDHLGNQFATMAEMSRYWNMNYQTLHGRLARGLSVEEALTGYRKIPMIKPASN